MLSYVSDLVLLDEDAKDIKLNTIILLDAGKKLQIDMK